MTTELWLEALSKLGGGAVVLAAIAAAFWKLFQALSTTWLDRRFEAKLKASDQAFEQQLTQSKQQHDVITRHLQSTIDRELDRARKLQDQEFETLSRAWRICHEAYWRTRDATNRAFRMHDLVQMGTQQRLQFIAGLDMPDWQKSEISAEQNISLQQAIYLKAWRMQQYSECEKWRMKLVMFADRKGIFMQMEIKVLFDELQELIRAALFEFELRIKDMNAGRDAYKEMKHADALREQGQQTYEHLERLIRARLWSPVGVYETD